MGKQESVNDLFQLAKDCAKAESELKIKKWVQITIEYNSAVDHGPVKLFVYDLPREVYERRRWVIRWRQARFQCQYPRQYVECYFHFYDRRSGESLGFDSCLSKLVSAKAQVTKAERVMHEYIEHSRRNNLFFNEETDEQLVKFRGKLKKKKDNVAECEKRLEELVKRKNMAVE